MEEDVREEEYDRFCIYSTYIRYLRAQDGVFPDDALEHYISFFPDRPLFPRVRSIIFEMETGGWLRFLLCPLHPTKDQPSLSPSTLRSLLIYRSPDFDPEREGKDLARDLAEFQRLNSRLGGGLEAFQDLSPFPEREESHLPRNPRVQEAIQEAMENAFSLPSPETTGAPVRGLRRLEVTHYLREFPAFFERVGRMRALEHLKIAIAYDPRIGEMGEEASMEIISPKFSRKGQSPNNSVTTHSASSLEIEGRWGELSLSISLCAHPSKVTRFRTLRLLYYIPIDYLVPAQGAWLLDLPADIIPPDSLEALTINLLENGVDIPDAVPYGIEGALKVDAFQPLLRYKEMVELHLELPYNILLDIDFLRVLAAVMCQTLRHLVILRRLDQWEDDDFGPVLTANDLPTIVVLMPRLETLGLDVSHDDISASANRDSSVACPLLQTLYVGTVGLWDAQVPEVARFLKEYFPGLQYLYHHEGAWEEEGPWSRIVSVNEYSDGSNGRWCGLPWGYWTCNRDM